MDTVKIARMAALVLRDTGMLTPINAIYRVGVPECGVANATSTGKHCVDGVIVSSF